VLREATARQPWSTITSKRWSSTSPTSISAAVDTLLLRSLKEHYLEVSKMNPPPVREHKLYLKTLLGFCFSLKSKTLFLFLLLKEPHEEFRVLDREYSHMLVQQVAWIKNGKPIFVFFFFMIFDYFCCVC